MYMVVTFPSFQCNQSDADREVSPFPGHCPEVNRHCVKWYPNYPNDKAKKYCEDWVPCSDCEAVSNSLIAKDALNILTLIEVIGLIRSNDLYFRYVCNGDNVSI